MRFVARAAGRGLAALAGGSAVALVLVLLAAERRDRMITEAMEALGE